MIITSRTFQTNYTNMFMKSPRSRGKNLPIQVLPIPDVQGAITVSQVHIERDNMKRMEDLEKRRAETYALRDLWRNLLNHRRARHIYNEPLSARDFVEDDSPLDPRHTLSSRACNHHSARDRVHDRSLGDLNFPRLENHFDNGGRVHVSPRRKDSSVPYHTAITMPPAKSKDKLRFNALNKRMVCRLPHLNDITHFPGYETRDMREWENEVKKVVPSRPALFLPASAQARPISSIFPGECEKVKDPACFFRTTRDIMSGKGREYMINPEWPSERCSPDSARARSITFSYPC